MKIGGILLAAGGSTRLGQPKQLLKLGERTLIGLATDTMMETLNKTITVVTGGYEKEVCKILEDKNVHIAHNRDWHTGMASSIKVGMKDLLNRELNIEAVLICLCDQPFLTSRHLKKLMTTSEETPNNIIASSYQDLASVPAIFKSSQFSNLLNLEGQQGARKVIRKSINTILSIPFPDGIFDVDTLEDWQKVKELYLKRKESN